MTNIEIKYPILLIRDKDNNLYAINKDLGLISKGGDSFYKRPMKMVDKNGVSFKLVSAKNAGKASLLNSIRYVQQMQQMHLEFKNDGKLNLNELKELILKHIKNNPKHWLTLGTIEMIEDAIASKKTISDLIKMFR